MKLTAFSRNALRVRRARKDLEQRGFEEVNTSASPLYDLHNGSRQGWHIVETAIGPEGKTVWVRLEPRDPGERLRHEVARLGT